MLFYYYYFLKFGCFFFVVLQLDGGRLRSGVPADGLVGRPLRRVVGPRQLVVVAADAVGGAGVRPSDRRRRRRRRRTPPAPRRRLQLQRPPRRSRRLRSVFGFHFLSTPVQLGKQLGKNSVRGRLGNSQSRPREAGGVPSRTDDSPVVAKSQKKTRHSTKNSKKKRTVRFGVTPLRPFPLVRWKEKKQQQQQKTNENHSQTDRFGFGPSMSTPRPLKLEFSLRSRIFLFKVNVLVSLSLSLSLSLPSFFLRPSRRMRRGRMREDIAERPA